MAALGQERAFAQNRLRMDPRAANAANLGLARTALGEAKGNGDDARIIQAAQTVQQLEQERFELVKQGNEKAIASIREQLQLQERQLANARTVAEQERSRLETAEKRLAETNPFQIAQLKKDQATLAAGGQLDRFGLKRQAQFGLASEEQLGAQRQGLLAASGAAGLLKPLQDRLAAAEAQVDVAARVVEQTAERIKATQARQAAEVAASTADAIEPLITDIYGAFERQLALELTKLRDEFRQRKNSQGALTGGRNGQ